MALFAKKISSQKLLFSTMLVEPRPQPLYKTGFKPGGQYPTTRA
jgi:hypothetical protein